MEEVGRKSRPPKFCFKQNKKLVATTGCPRMTVAPGFLLFRKFYHTQLVEEMAGRGSSVAEVSDAKVTETVLLKHKHNQMAHILKCARGKKKWSIWVKWRSGIRRMSHNGKVRKI